MIKAIGHFAHHSLSNLNPFEFDRAKSRARRLQIEALFCSACLSNIDQACGRRPRAKEDFVLMIPNSCTCSASASPGH
jgi:hypothetical protein